MFIFPSKSFGAIYLHWLQFEKFPRELIINFKCNNNFIAWLYSRSYNAINQHIKHDGKRNRKICCSLFIQTLLYCHWATPLKFITHRNLPLCFLLWQPWLLGKLLFQTIQTSLYNELALLMSLTYGNITQHSSP